MFSSCLIPFMFYIFTLTQTSNPSLMLKKESNTTKCFANCIKSAGLSFKGLTMLDEELQRSVLAKELTKALEAPVTIAAPGSELRRGETYLVFSQDTHFYKELLTSTTTEDDVMLIIILEWPNQVESDGTLDSIFSTVWDHRVYRTFVLVQQENSNINVYTYVTFVLNHCGKVGPPILVNIWDSAKKNLTSMFQSGNNSSKIPPTKHLHGCSFKCVVKNNPPESTVSTDGRGTVHLQGIAGQMMAAAMRLNNFTLTYELAEDVLTGYFRNRDGFVETRKTFQSISKVLSKRHFDIAFGYFIYPFDSSPDIDFVFLYRNDHFGFFVPCGTEEPKSIWTNYYLEFSVPTWVCFATLFFFNSLSLSLMSRILPGVSAFLSIERSVFILCGIHLGNILPFRSTSNAMRIFLVLIMFYSLILSVAYKASLKSFLVAPSCARSIQSWEELERSGLKIGGGPHAVSVVKDFSEGLPVLEKLLQHFQKPEIESILISDIVNSTSNRPDTALFGLESVITYLNTLRSDEHGVMKRPMCKVPRNVASHPVAPFITRKGSPLVRTLNRMIISHLEGGFTKDFGSPKALKPTPTSSLNSTPVAYTLEQLKGAFMLWFCGVLVASFACAFEILYLKCCFDRPINCWNVVY